MPGTSFTIHTSASDPGRTVTVTAIATTGAKATATFNEVAVPAPLPTPSPTPTPVPVVIPTAWVPAPLVVGGYAFVPDVVGTPPTVTQCCNGLIVKVVAQTMPTDVVPVPIWLVSYYTDTRGEVANADQFRLMVVQQNNLQGVTPSP
jgi:hypothetical protein